MADADLNIHNSVMDATPAVVTGGEYLASSFAK